MCEDEVAELIAQGQYALWSTGDLRTARAWFERAWTREAVDVVLAEHLIGAEEALTPSAGTVGRLTRALSLGRGKPLDGVQEHPWVDDQAQRLRQLRLRDEKRLAQAHLLLRQPAQAVTLLTSARRENPLDEQLHQFLMLALYRQGLPSQASASSRTCAPCCGTSSGSVRAPRCASFTPRSCVRMSPLIHREPLSSAHFHAASATAGSSVRYCA